MFKITQKYKAIDIKKDTVIYCNESLKINKIDIKKFKNLGLNKEYVELEYHENKKLLINPLHIIELRNDKYYIRFVI